MLISTDNRKRRVGNAARWLWLILPAGFLLAVAIVFAVFAASSASVSADASALARVHLPLGGGTVVSAGAAGPRGRPIDVRVEHGLIVPTGKIPSGERVTVTAVVARPGWIGWLGGSRQTVSVTVSTPRSALQNRYLTLKAGAPLRLHFSQPIATFAYGQPGAMHRRTFAHRQHTVAIARPSAAGTLLVAAAPRTWERQTSSPVSWFPAGAATSAVTSPSPGGTIAATTQITITFSKPYATVLSGAMPAITPATTGHWRSIDAHTLTFKPTGYGFGLGATVNVGLPHGVQVVGGDPSWTVPQGSSLRVNQILAQLGYLPLDWQTTAATVAPTPSAQLHAALNPPSGQFNWKWGNTPGSLRNLWDPNHQTVVTQGALMAFEEHQGIYGTAPSPAVVWHALMAAAIKDQSSSFGYTFVTVTESNQQLSLWHSGHTVMTTPVNTGIPGAATATGVFPVFEHIPSGTMSGTNPDGSHYNDPGIPWISYFNGGDALHGFVRASYGSPQSLGCVEMAPTTAGRVYPYTPIGTLVNVE